MKKAVAKSVSKYSLILFFLICLVSTFHYHQIYRDGSAWAYQIFNRVTLIANGPHLRYTSMFLQVPAALASYFFKNAKLSYWLYCVGYMIYPFAALMLLSSYLKKHGKEDLNYIFVLSFFLTIVPTWSFSNSITCETVVMYWFVFAYVIVTPTPRLGIVFIFNLLLLFSYESGYLFYGVTLFLLWREKKLNFQHILLSIFFIVAQNLNLFFRIFPANEHAFFLYSLKGLFHSPFLIAIIGGGIGIILSVMKFPYIRYFVSAFMMALIGFVIYKLAITDPSIGWIETFDNRVWTIPAAVAIFITMYEIFRRQGYRIETYQLWMIILLSLPAFLFQSKLSHDSYIVFNKIKNKVNEIQGCYVLSAEEQKELTDNHLQGWDFPYYSIIANNTKKIHTILFKDYDTKEEKWFCKLVEDQFLDYSHKWGHSRIYMKGNYDFSLIRKELK